MKSRLLLAAMATTLTCVAADPPEWRQPFAAHRVVGNVYYVGTYDLASFLIVTPAGNVLINGGLADSVPLMQKSVADLGFQWKDIRWMLTTQAHFDHVAAFAEIQRTTGAKVLATEADAKLLEDGGRSDFHFTGAEYHYAPVKVAERIQDGQTLKIGGTEITVYLHPGHTKGSASYAIPVTEGGRTYRVLIANIGTINPGVKLLGEPHYPGIAADYAKTFEKQKALSCDIFLSSHAGQYGLHQKYTPGAAYDPSRFVDPAGYQKAVAGAEAEYRKQLAEEKAAH
ncbi:MAG TPA: subclass B3 metallo-beta-lactamase [Candidatus Solibacter sp.]|jgi:metallo-beta-lactamase class B